VARYEHESMGAKRFVELVSCYLADHRGLFDDPVRRRKLVDCIAVFVDAGWAEARRLFQNLPELMQ
jgi:DTW domain-containing protein YfiP